MHIFAVCHVYCKCIERYLNKHIYAVHVTVLLCLFSSDNDQQMPAKTNYKLGCIWRNSNSEHDIYRVSNASPRDLTSNRKSSIESPQTKGDSSQSPYPSHVNPRGNPHTHGSPGYHPSRGCRGYRSSPRRRTNRHRIVRRHGAKSRRRFNKPRVARAAANSARPRPRRNCVPAAIISANLRRRQMSSMQRERCPTITILHTWNEDHEQEEVRVGSDDCSDVGLTLLEAIRGLLEIDAFDAMLCATQAASSSSPQHWRGQMSSS